MTRQAVIALTLCLAAVPASAQERWSAWNFSNVDSFLRWRWIAHTYGPDILPNCEFEFRDELPRPRLLHFKYRVSYKTSTNRFGDRVGAQYVSIDPVGDSINDCTSISLIWFEEYREVAGGPAPVAPSGTDTYFIDVSDVFTSVGQYRYQGFSVSRTTTFDLRFAAAFAADAAVIPAGEFSNFTAGGSFVGYGVFDNAFGTKPSITLGPGSYYAVARSQSARANTIRFEVDYRFQLPGAQFYDWYMAGNEVVQPNGGKVWRSFVISPGLRLFLDGCNSGVETYILPNDEIDNFINGRGFRYYSDYGGDSQSFPGQWEIELPAGTYWLVFRNQDAVAHSVTWRGERWRNVTGF